MFYLKEPKSDKQTPIYLIYRIQGKNFKISTGERIHPSQWDFERQWPDNKKKQIGLKGIEAVLRRLQEKVDNYITTCKLNGKEPTLRGLKEQFSTNRIITFNDFVNNYVDNAGSIKLRNGKPIGKRTLQAYSTTRDFFNEFGTVEFKDLDMKLHSNFIDFLKKEKRHSVNTFGGYIKNIRKFAREANKSGYPVNPVILSDDFFVPQENSDSIYLNEQEIDKLFKLEGLSPRWKKVRDWAIIGLWTGLRVSDWDKFNPKGDFIEIETHKTGKKVVIPLHHQVKEIIKDGMPERCSDQEFNRVIKKVCKKAGITQKVYGSRKSPNTKRLEKGYMEKYKMVSSHTCRRSFATNNYLMGIDTLTIMQITGHTTEKNFLKYIKVTPTQHAKRLLEKWNEYYSNGQ